MEEREVVQDVEEADEAFEEEELDAICGIENEKELAVALGARKWNKSRLERLLLHATSRNKVDVCKFLLSIGVDLLKARDGEGNSALHVAAHRGSIKCLKLFVSANASLLPKLRNKLGRTALDLAKSFHNDDCVSLLLDYNPYYDSEMLSLKDLKKGVILPPEVEALKSCSEDDLAKLEELVSLHPSTRLDEVPEDRVARGGYGVSPLHLSAYYGSIKCLKYILGPYNGANEIDVNRASVEERKTALHFAVENNQTKAVRSLLKNAKIMVDAQDKRMRTPLHYSVDCEDAEIITRLANSGSDHTFRDYIENIPLHYSADRSALPIFERHCDISSMNSLFLENKEGIAPMDILMLNREMEMLEAAFQRLFSENEEEKKSLQTVLSEQQERVLLRSVQEAISLFRNEQVVFAVNRVLPACGVSIDTISDVSLVYASAACGNSDILELLVSMGAEFTSFSMASPLMIAISTDNQRCALYMLKHMPPETLRDESFPIDGIILRASFHGMVLKVEYLLDEGLVTAERLSMLYVGHVCCSNTKANVEVFLRYLHGVGVDLTAFNEEGDTILHVACRNGAMDGVIDVLVSCGCSIHDQTRDEHLTPLFVAVQNGHADIVRKLLQLGANVEIPGESVNALHVAASFGEAESLRVLIAGGSDIHALTAEGETALHMAIGNNRAKCVSALVEEHRKGDPGFRISRELWEAAVLLNSVEAFYTMYQLEAYNFLAEGNEDREYVRDLANALGRSKIQKLLSSE